MSDGRVVRQNWLAVAAVAALGVWLFADVLGGELFVFRDAAHYYYPLFQWTSWRWGTGELPLWNPHENCGVPLAAETTSSVFYPGKLLFALPLTFATSYATYVVGHWVMAAGAAYWLARQWQVSVTGAVLAALAYAGGGSVLFQYCNVVFLVGAAWLPLALLAARRMIDRRSYTWAALLGAVLALMTLGGDPETAYHAGLLAAVYAVLVWRMQRRQLARVSANESVVPAAEPAWRACCRRPAVRLASLLAVAAGSGGALAAVQIVPAAEWAAVSVRGQYELPRSIWEVPPYVQRRRTVEDPDARSLAGGVARGLAGAPQRRTHHAHIYYYSLGPWRLAELFWSNLFGKLLPVYRRWIDVLPSEGRVWTPSLYLGLLPCLLGLSSLAPRSSTVHIRWLTWTFFLAVLGSFGWYGLGWLVREGLLLTAGSGVDMSWLGAPTGGLYWLMVVLLPGYAYFRYPAKLFVVAALALSVLAGIGWDHSQRSRSRRLARCLAAVASLSVAGLLAAWIARRWWPNFGDRPRADVLYGPLDAAGAWSDIYAGLVQALVLCAAGWLVFRLLRTDGSARRWAAPLLLALTVVDLGLANGWMVVTAPRELWRQPPPLAEALQERLEAADSAENFRVYRGAMRGWLPDHWVRRSSSTRPAEGMAWDHATMFPKYPLLSDAPLSLVDVPGTMSSRDYHAVLYVARRHGVRRQDGVVEPSRQVLDTLATRYLVLPESFQYPQTRPLPWPASDPSGPPLDAALWENPQALPRAWIAARVEAMPPLRGGDPERMLARTEEVFFPGGQPREFGRTAVVETERPLVEWQEKQAGGEGAPFSPARCRIVAADLHRLELEAELRRPGLLVLSDLMYPGWRAFRYSGPGEQRQPCEIYRTNRIMRGVWLPAGRHRVVFQYRPWRVYAGGAVSIGGWLLLAVLLVVWRRRGPRSGGRPGRR